MISAATTDIALRSIDLDHMEDVEENLEAVEFSVRLSAAPTKNWIGEFEEAYKRLPYTLKPPVQIEDDQMKIIYLPRYADELPSYFDFLRRAVDLANGEARRSEDIHNAHVQDSRKVIVREALQKIKL